MAREHEKTREEYLEDILALLDDAATDKGLSTQDYADLCDEVAENAAGRRDAAKRDLEKS